MIKAVIFDCFGVLVQATLNAFHTQFLHDNVDLIKIAHELDRRTNLGIISYEQFITEMAKLANKSEAEVEKFLDNTPPNLKLLEYIKYEIKPKYKLGILSNASENWLNDLLGRDYVNMFDDVVLSCDVFLVKPDPEIFNLSAKRLGISVNECIFVDDIVSYCESAEKVGMQAILYKNFNDFKKDISALI